MADYNVNVLIITGKMGSGKSTAARFISKNYGFQHLNFVDCIWKPILEERKLEANRENLQKLGIELMETLGPDKLVCKLFRNVKSGTNIVIDDIRREDVVHIIKNLCQKVFLIYVETATSDRHLRLETRDNISSTEKLLESERTSTELTISALKKHANVIIENKGDVEDYFLSLREVFSKERLGNYGTKHTNRSSWR